MDGYQLLGNAIVKQAAHDYEYWLVRDHRISTNETRGHLKELESYFKGTQIKYHTKLSGVALMEAIKKQVIDYNYDLKALNKARRIYKPDDKEED
jgi:hypothetical protein